MTMDRVDKLELIKRSLGLRHKLKVHESLKAPDNHEELAMMMLTKWELEDEMRAIEEILSADRGRNVARKRSQLEAAPIDPNDSDAAGDSSAPARKRSRK